MFFVILLDYQIKQAIINKCACVYMCKYFKCGYGIWSHQDCNLSMRIIHKFDTNDIKQ